MHTTCAAAFNPKVWTCATTPRKPRCPSCFVCGITSPGAALCTAQRNNNRTDSSRQEQQINELQGVEEGEQLILRFEAPCLSLCSGWSLARTAVFNAIWAWR